MHGLLLLLAACYSGTANAQTPGTQDSAYEVLAPEGESWAMLATQVDGKVLAVSNAHSDSPGHLIVYRFNHDGEPAISFSGERPCVS